MDNLDIKRQRDSRKIKLSTDLLRQIKKHLEFETIGVKEGTQIRVVEIKEVLSDLLTTWDVCICDGIQDLIAMTGICRKCNKQVTY